MANLHVNLAFSADTGKAKAQIQELQTLLSKIAYTGSTTNVTGTMQDDLKKASMAAKDLQFHLNNAFNTTTGKFDLSLLDKSLKTSGTNISNLSTQLLGAGETGQQAFMKLAQSISLADQPMLRVSKRMQEFAVTMKNTVKWQLSSSMLHGFMGAIQSAYGYAQDLNKSLTDIRIVTGYSADQMAVFAEQANKAAKSLSTTTNDYTNASLIYFQQGLTDAEVAERTAVTVKMANAAGESAQIVSDQLTAVWNNFYDGSKSLEYYADVMTALGAATASSTDEISEGLSKFAAVAETVGLSYEYATAALTTITSNTRESADVVGNALKTLFARIQGLKLGETLEDGVDLNKYSEALDKAGISIFESNGELKAMDNILIELAGRWDTMSNTQQVALAQTVAGVRQYTQLIALMENWDNGDADSMMANLRTIEGAEGALDEQAEIYAQSWEAASKRVQAAAEGIYQSLLDDDFFISLSNGFANLLGGLDAFIDGAGGVKTVLTGLASIALSTFAHQIPDALDTFRYNLEFVTKGSQVAYDRIQKQMNAATKEAFDKFNATAGQSGISEDSAVGYAIKQANELTAARNKLALVSDKMSAAERQSADIQLGLIQAQQEEVVILKQKNEELQESIRLQQESIRRSQVSDTTRGKTMKSSEDMSSMYLSYNDTLIELEEQRNNLIQTINERTAQGRDTTRQEDNLTRINAEIEQYEALTYAAVGFANNYKDAIQGLGQMNNRIGRELFDIFTADNFDTASSHVISFAQEFEIAFDQIEETLTNPNLDFSDSLNLKTVKDQVKALQSAIPEAIQSATGLDTAFNRVATAMDANELEQAFLALKLSINNCTLEGTDFQRVLESLYGKSITQIAADMQKLAQNTEQANQKAATLKKLFDEFKPDHTVRMSEAMGSLAGLMGNVVTIANTLISMFQSLGNPDLSGWEKFSAVLTGLSVLIPTVVSSITAAVTANEFLSGSFKKSAAAAIADGLAKSSSKVATLALTAANWLLNASLGPLLLVILAITAAIGLAVLAFKGLKSLFQWMKSQTPEGQLKAAEEATKGMATAAEEATAAYEELLDTISGYDSAISALEGLEVGTQEFTNALITANEKAWELIDTYGLIQDQDWDYGENGEIIINNEAKNRITDQANERREDAVVAASAAEIAEAQAAYNLSQSKAGMVGYDIQQGNLNDKVLYDALGLTNGSFEHLKGQVQFDKYGNLESVGVEIGDAVAQALYGKDYDALDTSQLEYINNNIFKYLDEIEVMYGDYDNLNNVSQNQRQKMISTSLSDEEAYQQTAWKGLITEELDKQYDTEKSRQDELFAAKTDEQVASDFAKYLTDQGYIQGEDGKVYKQNEDGTQGDEVTNLSNLSADAQRNILAAVEAMKTLENQGVEMAEGFNQVASTMSDEEATMADALINNNLGALTEEQIQQLKAAGDIKPEDLFDPQTLAAIRNNPVLNAALEGWLADLEKSIAEWEPPPFDIEDWKKDYAEKMNIINDLETGDSISAEDYAILGEEYQQYFSEQLDGTYKLIGTANEFKTIVESIELGKLKEDINTKKGTISQMNTSDITTSSGRTLDFNAAHNAANEGKLHETWDEAYIESINEALKTNYTTVEEANIAWNNYESSLLASASTLAMSIDNFDDLDKVFKEGLITVDDYNKKLKELTDMLDEDVDEEQYENLTEIIQSMAEASDENNEGALEFSENLKDNEKAAKKVAEAILRYDSAVEDVKKNSKDWMKILKSGNLQDMADIMDDLENSYNDLLDLDGSVLSDDFITNAENLELMTKAANGSTEAYDELARRANEDIIAQCKLEADFDSTKFDAALLALQNEIAAIDLPNIEVGCDLMGEESFIAACNDIINAAGMTAAEAQAYLGNMGVDATVVSEPEVTEDTTTVVSMIPKENSLSGTALNPVTGLSAPYYFPGADYDLVPETQTTTKTTTATALKVESATKSSGGGIKHANSSSGSGSNSKPSGGGGGGSKKQPKYAEKKSSSEKTRYHTLQNQLEDLTAEYDALADASDRAFGQDKLDAIDAEIKKTDELIDKQEEYLQAIQSDLPVDKSVMTAYYNDTIGGPAMQFDENGNISNYDQIQDAMFNKYNAMTAYDEESLEWQTFEKKYEQLEKYIEQYEETYDLLREEEANYQDLLNQRIDLELEKVEYKVEIQLEVPENQKEVIEYQLGRIEDDAKKTGEALALLTEQAEMTYDQILINKQGLNDALELSLSAAEITEVMAGNMDILNGKTFTEDQISAIQDYKDNLLELNEEFDEIRESIEETVLEAFDMWHEKLEEGIEKFDYFGTILESYQSIIDTVGKDTLGISDSLMNTLSQASVDNAINEVEATRDAYKALQQAQIDAEQELEKAKARGDEQSISFWESTLNEIQQNAEDAHEEMLSSWEEALSKIVEQFEASVQTAVDAFNEAVYQLGGIEALSEEFDRQKEMADMYLDDYQKIYELSKLNRDVNNSIDDTDSLAGKQKLKKLLGEINKLQADGVKMSEYDLEYLQAEYDLRLAEIALEEAQRAKDVVRLSRDNEGNWSYVYTQNTEAVDEAQQKYEDALYAMQDLSSNYIDEISAQLIETSQEMQEALAAIRIEDYASIEEYYEEVERVQEQYQEQLALQEEELNKAIANNKELYDTDWINYHNAVGYKISDTEEFATKFSDTLLGTLMNSESDTSNFTNILADATSTLMNELYGAAEQYYTNMAAAMEAAGTTTGTFADDLATNVDQIKQDSEEAATAVEDMATHMQEQMDNIINKVGEWQRTYGEAMNEIINANLAVIDSFNEMLATLSMDDSTVTVKYDIQNHNSDVLDAERFATGGYTGSWGNTGRLGILDEKELILNKDDTENFIEALKISRSMLNTIDLNARQASLGLGTLIPTTVKDDIKETLEQVVQITAEFPNATDHNEIEEAFNMLINRASQFANRK